MIVQIKAYFESLLIISSKLAWAHSTFTHVFVNLDQSANTRIPQGLHITKTVVFKERLKWPNQITRLTAHFMCGKSPDV